jgi:competence protein ComEA
MVPVFLTQLVQLGGLTDLANLAKVNLAYLLKDGQKIYIPSIDDNSDLEYIQNTAGENVIVTDSNSNSNLININTATEAELTKLPGVGSSTANKIIDYRNKNGNFKNIEDLKNVNGIGNAKFESFKEYICI